jgi:uncharacterized membrane protein
VLQISMPGLDPRALVELGHVLAPLRREGVLMIGSGFLTHNMRYAFRPGVPGWAKEFDAWAEDALSRFDVDALVDFHRRAPAARTALPTWEHYAPLLVAVGAALTAGEIPPPVKAAGIALVSAGVLCVGASPHAPLKATLWALGIGLCISSYSLVDALGARAGADALVYVAWTSGLMGVPMIAYALWRKGGSGELMRAAAVAPWRGVAIGIISFAGYGLVLWAQTFAPIAQVTALRETSVVFAALIAFLVLGERLGPRRWLGALIVALGAGLIAFG